MSAGLRAFAPRRVFRIVGIIAALMLTVIPLALSRAQQAPPASGRRFRADSSWVRVWVRGAKDEPDLFVEPRQLIVTDSVVAVLDLGTREVIALSTDSGRTRFTLAAKGEGPGEFKRPARLVNTTSLIGVLDHATSRLTMFNARGVMARDTPLPDASNVEGACGFSDGSVLVKVAGVRNALRVVDSVGRTLRQRALPGHDLNRPPPTFATAAHLAGPMSKHRCALVPSYGRWWYTTDARGTTIAHPYVEPGADVVVRVASSALDKSWRGEVRKETQTSAASPIARGALHIGDTVVVQAGATKRSAHRLLDYYLISNGHYLYSRTLPVAFTALAVGPDGTFYGAVIGDEVSWVVALRPTTRKAGLR
ncbi:MAG: hypothetical protein ABMA00_06770 [Gemmatimonas sp.]